MISRAFYRGLVGLALLASCATGASGPWPPAAGGPQAADERRRTIVVSVDTWHATIAIPLESGAGFEEWGYAERAWYLEGRQGAGGALRALLWPTEAVVEVATSDRILAHRTRQPPADAFAFELSDEGYRRLREHLAGTLASREPVAMIGASAFYRARHTYHLFHQCHQYAARALQVAGLPVSPLRAFTRASFAADLRRAQEQQSTTALAPAHR